MSPMKLQFCCFHVFLLNKYTNGINCSRNMLKDAICCIWASHAKDSDGTGSITVINALESHTKTMKPNIMCNSLFPLNIFFLKNNSNMLYPDNNSEKKKFT